MAVAFVAVAVCGASPIAQAADEATNQGVAVGQAGPAWTGLQGVDDKTHSLDEYADAKLVVVVFTCNHCPVARAYEDRLLELANDYQDKGVQVVAINVNNIDADKLPAMKQRAADKGFNFPYLYDPSQQIGRDYGATVTPHAFVLDQDRNVAYMGAIDDSQNPSNVTQQHLRDAIDALLAGQTPEMASTEQFGCGIQYE
jgi:peroxiredoxin